MNAMTMPTIKRIWYRDCDTCGVPHTFRSVEGDRDTCPKCDGELALTSKWMPSIVFATMCKNESHCIRKTLEAVAPYVDRFLIYDTGSTDGTMAIAEQFFADSGIYGDVYCAEWEGFAVSKTKMMALAKRLAKSRRSSGEASLVGPAGAGPSQPRQADDDQHADYILHLDADDVLVKLNPSEIDKFADAFSATLTRGTSTWKATVLYGGQLTWRFCGVAHTIIRAVEKASPIIHDLPGCVICADEVGIRAADPKKYAKDAELLVQQYMDTADDDPDGLHSRSAFYAAQSFFDAREYQRAYDWYSTYLVQAKTWIEEVFEAKLRRARCAIALGMPFEAVRNHFALANQTLGDRAEPHLYFGRWCNQQSNHRAAYAELKLAQAQSLAVAQKNYVLFVDQHAYGKYVNDELAVACYWLGKGAEDGGVASAGSVRLEEGIDLVKAIIDDPDFAHVRERLADNLQHLERALSERSERWDMIWEANAVKTEDAQAPVSSPLPPGADKLRQNLLQANNALAVARSPSRIVIADNFYTNPLAVRSLALCTPFVTSAEYHRGKRTLASFARDGVRAEFERLMGRKISKWDYGTNGVFQICNAQDPIVYHADTQQYAAVIYLTPDAPADAGTSFFRCKATGARSTDETPGPKFERGFYDRSQFELIDQIGNLFNRCVIWDARLLHAATSYFGSNDENARLFQMWFFDVEPLSETPSKWDRG